MGITRRHLLLSGLGGAALTLLGDTGGLTVPPTDMSPVGNMVWPAVAPHRGGLATHPEGTMQAYKALARDFPGYGLEMDVRQLKDKALVIFHDKTVDRVAAGSQTGRPEDMTTAQWRQLRIKDPNGGPPAPAAFLNDILAEFGGTDTILLTELKTRPAINDFIRTLWPYRDQVIACCFTVSVVSVFVRAGFQTQQLVSDPTKPFVGGVQNVGILNTKASKAFCNYAHAEGVRVWVWGDDMDLGRDKASLMANGVDGFIPNDPRP